MIKFHGTTTAIAILLSAVIIAVDSNSQDDDYDDGVLGDEFYSLFASFEREERLHDTVYNGLDSWETRCLRIGGEEVLKRWHKSQEELISCVIQNFDYNQIKYEVETKMKTGDLDLVFKKYCGDPIAKTRPCFHHFLDVSAQCLDVKSRADMRITRAMIEAAIDFLCYHNGDRMALFIAGNGRDCVQSRQDQLVSCINGSVPEIFNLNNHTQLDLLVFGPSTCFKMDKLRACVEHQLYHFCEDTTVSNIVDALIVAVRRVTPCDATSNSLVQADGGLDSGRSRSRLDFSAAFVTALLLVTSSCNFPSSRPGLVTFE